LDPDLNHSAPPTDNNLGRRLGSYEITQRIGEGGMGVVYRGRHIESGETLAIKLIKRGMDTDSVLRRFHNERRILESLSHPNIARILDAGATPEGLPYFVMEHIAGQPISLYCDSNKLSVPARLRLFEKVCSAVQCAHESNIVHRDIKPENILVTPDGEPKLLDFGIAKVLEMRSPTQEATITILPVMTPHYASPEQARGAPVNAASDIYSLGVLLYELLAGSSPYRSTGSAAAFVHAIAHEAPLRPSSVVTQKGLTDPKAEAIAASRSTSLSALRRELAGDLDAIVLTALDKDPAGRYRSVADFSADIESHLQGSRVNARKLKWRYMRLPARTRRAILAGMVALACFALLGIYYVRMATQKSLSVRPSVAVLGFQNLSNQPSEEWLSTALTEMFSTELAEGGRLRTVPGELVARVKLEMGLANSQTLTKATLNRLRDNLGADYLVVGAYLSIGQGNSQRVRLDLRLQDTRTGELVASASDTRTTPELVNLVTNAGARLRGQLGVGSAANAASAVRGSVPDEAGAARLYSEGLERLHAFDSLGARDLLKNAVVAAPGHALSHAALAAASSLLGYDVEARDEARKALDLSAGLRREDHLSIEGRYFETTRAWDRAAATYRTLFNEYPDNLEYGLRLAVAQSQSGEPRRALQTIRSLRALPTAARDPRVDLTEAEALFAASDLKPAREAATRAAQAGAAQGMRILAARAHLITSRIALASGDPQGALSAAAQSQQMYLAAGHRQGVAWALNETAGVLTQRGDVAGARARYEEALAVCRTIGDQSCMGTDLDSIGVLRRRQGDLKGALEMHKQALETRRAVGDRGGVATSLYNLGNVHEILGDLPRARQALSEALETRRQLGERRSTALTMSRMSNVRRREGELDEALRMGEEAVSTLRAVGDRGGVAMALANLGLVLLDRGDLASSRSAFEEALAVRRQQHDRNNTAQTAAGLAQVALAQDRLSEAAALITESISLRQELGEKITMSESNIVYSAILLEQEKTAAAEKAARDAASTLHSASAWASEGDALLAISRAQLARGDSAGARATLASAEKVLAENRDARLGLRLNVTMARVLQALGRKDEAASFLERALPASVRLGFVGMTFEIRLASLEPGQASASQLASEAQQAGFLLVARKARVEK
jgi:serine/threonine protein kinase/tetratricopeptide (TPR) repeat protein